MRITDKEYKINSNAGGSSNPPLNIHACVESGDFNGVQIILSHDPSLLNLKKDKTLETPLHISAGHGKIEITKYLLEREGEVELEAKNAHGETPLHMAAKNGNGDIVRILLQHGANKEARTNNSMTPLHLAEGYASQYGENSALKALLEFNGDCSSTNTRGLTPSTYLPEGFQDNELLELLRQNAAETSLNSTSYTSSLYGNLGAQNNYNYSSFLSQNNYNGIGSSSSIFGNLGSQNNYNGTNYSSTGNQDNNYSDDEIQSRMREFEEELSKIVGLNDLKSQLRKWAKGMLLDEKRRAMGLNLGPRKRPHMAFLGNPGTGKTTIARILGKLLRSVGVLSSDKVIEVQRSDLVAEYLGQTATKTKRKIEEATGKILFVDEAYRLTPVQSSGSHTDYGVEALEEIMSVLEDGDIVVIFAGYTEEMKRVFGSNPGFCRRVTHFFQFDDFTCKDLTDMLMLKMTKKDEKSRLNGFKLHPSCTHGAVLALIERNSTEKLRNKLNGGLVDHVLNNARENLDSRLSFDSTGDELLTITLKDLEAGIRMLADRVEV